MIEKLKEKFGKIRVYALIFLVFLFILSLLKNISEINEAKQRVLQDEKRLVKLQEESKALEEELKFMQSNEYLESQLRNKLGLAKEKETVVILPDSDSLKKLVPEIPSEESTLPLPPYKKWMKLFDLQL